jgi:hypothetical protein
MSTLLCILLTITPQGQPNADTIDCFDLYELTMKSPANLVKNPFLDITFKATIRHGNAEPVTVDGFCDSPDGSVYKLRYMPRKPGDYEVTTTFSALDKVTEAKHRFTARAGKRAGPVRVDPQYPFHFLREGSKEHWFWNGNTTYQLFAWEDEQIIRDCIDRQARLGINRLRCAINCRTPSGKRWNEVLVQPTKLFTFKMEPWIAARPENIEDPGYDLTRYHVAFFQKVERAVQYAREKGVIISIIFYLDAADKGVDPFGGKTNESHPMEDAYYRYIISRLAAYENVMWDITNEWHLFRGTKWVNRMGELIQKHDPSQHLISVHGNATFPFRKSPWASFAMYQSWDEHGAYGFMLKNRKEQLAAGKPMPQVNEEYGYEDHYPTPWGGNRVWPARIGDNRRRLAWEMSMAGCYQTTGERANDGTGAGPDTGGGWINGRGNETMTMLIGYQHMKSFFTRLEWWKLEPQPKGPNGTLVLAEKDKIFVAYQPKGGKLAWELPAGKYEAKWYNPRSGVWSSPWKVEHTGGIYASDEPKDTGDWAMILTK